MEKFLLDPNVLYPVGTKMWSIELGDCVIDSNNNTKEYPYFVINNNNRGFSFELSGRYTNDGIYPSLFLYNPLESIGNDLIKLENRKVLVWDEGDAKYEQLLAFKVGGHFFTYQFKDDFERVIEDEKSTITFTRWKNCTELPTPKTKLTKQQICDMFSITDFDLVD